MRYGFSRSSRQYFSLKLYQISHVVCRNDYKPYTTENSVSNFNLAKFDHNWRQVWKIEQSRKSYHGSVNQEISVGFEPTKKMYILPMFPYPSGDLHLGHLRVYTISDALARFYRMCNYDVIHPIGWDAFGLPAENAAIERGIDPKIWTKQNIERMKDQLEHMNGHWDWERELSTSDPSFYKHTQKLFILLYKAGLAYQAEATVNYDPVDKTVLANEQVDSNGISWRSGAKVEKRLLKQWYLRISKYRQELLDDLDSLEKNNAWPERVLTMQKNWVGKSTGAKIKFSVVANNSDFLTSLEVYTTRPDTLIGVQYVALAPTHPIVKLLATKDSNLKAFLDTVSNLPSDSKIGYELPNFKAINPLSDEESMPRVIKAPIPVYVAPYVLGDYGNAAIMGVPGHDIRDHAFWQLNRPEEPARCVVTKTSKSAMDSTVLPFTSHGFLTSENGPYSYMTTLEASNKILKLLESKSMGYPAESWRLRDWLVSRQRYWGTPIPIIHCESCGPVPVPDEKLPVELPPLSLCPGKSKTGNPLEKSLDWINTDCPSCGRAAKRDSDTLDTFVDSSWYFLRFLDPRNENEFLSPEIAKTNLPVDIYVGGVEHAILHLLYARFIFKFLNTNFKLSEKEHLNEPFKILIAQGMVHGKTYSDPTSGRFLRLNDLNLQDLKKPIVKATGEAAKVSYEKMSKSKYNGVDPSICREKYGADALRAHILFQSPVSEILEWDEEKICGVVRWLRRLHDYISSRYKIWIMINCLDNIGSIYPKDLLINSELVSSTLTDRNDTQNLKIISKGVIRAIPNDLEPVRHIWRAVQGTIIKVTNSYCKTRTLNTIVSDLMMLTNTIMEFSSNEKETDEISIQLLILFWALQDLLKMMAPITPAFAEECWMILRAKNPVSLDRTKLSLEPQRSIFSQPFPKTDNTFDLLTPATRPCAVQINGRLKTVVEIPTPPKDLSLSELENWITNEILNTEEEKEKLTGKMIPYRNIGKSNKARKNSQNMDLRTAKKIIVVRGGKAVNYVM